MSRLTLSVKLKLRDAVSVRGQEEQGARDPQGRRAMQTWSLSLMNAANPADRPHSGFEAAEEEREEPGDRAGRGPSQTLTDAEERAEDGRRRGLRWSHSEEKQRLKGSTQHLKDINNSKWMLHVSLVFPQEKFRQNILEEYSLHTFSKIKNFLRSPKTFQLNQKRFGKKKKKHPIPRTSRRIICELPFLLLSIFLSFFFFNTAK